MLFGSCIITVYFEDPFWVGLYERWDEEGCRVCKLTFGAEPKDYQVYELLLRCWRELVFSPAVSGGVKPPKKAKPRRERREADRKLSGAPVGTKAQEALKLQRQAEKSAARERSHQERETEEERKFQLRQEKKRQKHKGH